MTRPHVVVIGAGFGGLRVAKGLRHVDVDVTVVDRNNFHTFQPLLYQVATAGLDAGDVSFPVRATLRRSRSARFVLGDVVGVDLGGRNVALADGRCLAYDRVVVAVGSVSTSFGVPGVDEHTFALKTLQDAVGLRTHVLRRFEQAAAAPPGERPSLDIVVVGGGPTGIETAGGMRELLDHVLAADHPELPVAEVRITLVEAGPRLLAPMHPESSARAESTLRDHRVEVLTGVGVAAVQAGAVVLADGRRLPAGTIVWAAGVAAHPLAAALAEQPGVEVGRGGRLVVGGDLTLGSYPEVYAIGDVAISPTDDGHGLPQVAQPAIQGGAYVAAHIAAQVAGRSMPGPFAYRDKGSMATIGRNQAITELAPGGLLRGRRFYGFVGWAMWLGLHLVYLMGFRNRIAVLVNWAWNYLTYDRAARTLVAAEDAGDHLAGGATER